MRLTVIALVACLCGSAPALGAPICQNRLGDLVHCDAPSAMPVGWTVSPRDFEARVLSHAPRPATGELVGVGVVLACLFAIIALMPRFDGSRSEDWDRQEGDEVE
jgi:hypothetical protein